MQSNQLNPKQFTPETIDSIPLEKTLWFIGDGGEDKGRHLEEWAVLYAKNKKFRGNAKRFSCFRDQVTKKACILGKRISLQELQRSDQNARKQISRANQRDRQDVEYFFEQPKQQQISEQGSIETRIYELRAAINSLPDTARIIICKVYLEGSTIDEVSDELQIKPSTVYEIIRSALKFLQRRLE